MSAFIKESFAEVTALELSIMPELRDLLPPLSEEQRKELKESIRTSEIYAPLVGWNDGKTWWLVDGYNRRSILMELLQESPSFTEPDVLELKADSVEEVKAWIIQEHIARRNLTPLQLSELRGQVYNSKKAKKAENLPKGQNDPSEKQGKNERTSEAVAEQFGVSEKTIRRDGDFAKGMEVLDEENPEAAQKIRSGEAKVNKKDVERLGRKAEEVEADESPEAIIKEKRKPFTSLVTKIGEVIAEFERMADKPGGEYIDDLAVQEMKRKGGNLQEVIKARRPALHKPCKGKGCETCRGLGYVREN